MFKPNQDNNDGIIVRTVKSRILDRSDRAKKDRVFESKQQQQNMPKNQHAKSSEDLDKKDNGKKNREQAQENDRKRSEKFQDRLLAQSKRDGERRKEKKQRRNDRENRRDETNKGSTTDLNSGIKFVSTKSEPKSEHVEKSIGKDEKIKKYSESRRERRTSRNEIRSVDGDKKTGNESNRDPAKELQTEVKDNLSSTSNIELNVTDESSILKRESKHEIGDSIDGKKNFTQENVDDETTSVKSGNKERRASMESKHDSSSGGENSRDNSKAAKERDLKRIRNKVNTKFYFAILIFNNFSLFFNKKNF